MKTALQLLSFLLVAFSTISLSAVDASPDPVLDTTGNYIRSGANYHILPVFWGKGGRAHSSQHGQQDLPTRRGPRAKGGQQQPPLTFTPVNPEKGFIRVSTDLNIKSSAATKCVQSTVWKLDYDKSLKQYFIASGGIEENPSLGTLSNWFKIEKYDNDYKFLFFPLVCKYCKVICRDIGTFIEKGTRRLALSNVPFKVMFKKA